MQCDKRRSGPTGTPSPAARPDQRQDGFCGWMAILQTVSAWKGIGTEAVICKMEVPTRTNQI